MVAPSIMSHLHIVTSVTVIPGQWPGMRVTEAPFINAQICGTIVFVQAYLLYTLALQWRHNEPDCVSNHQPHDCLLNRLFRRGSKKTSKLRVTGLCAGNSPGTGEFPAQRPVTRKMFPFDYVIMGIACIFDRYRHSKAAVTHVKYDIYVQNVAGVSIITKTWKQQNEENVLSNHHP